MTLVFLAVATAGLLGLIRSRGHFPKGGYDVPDGATNQESAPTPAV